MSELYATLGTLIGEELATPPVALTPATQLDDIPGWDSVALAGVILAIETRFGTAVSRAQVDGIHTAADLAALCAPAA